MANRGSFPNIATRNANQQAMVDAGLTTGDTCTVDDVTYNWQDGGWESPWPRPTYPGGGGDVTLTLSTSSPTPTSILVTRSEPTSGTLQTWTLEYKKYSDVGWTLFADNLTGLTQTVPDLDSYDPETDPDPLVTPLYSFRATALVVVETPEATATGTTTEQTAPTTPVARQSWNAGWRLTNYQPLGFIPEGQRRVGRTRLRNLTGGPAQALAFDVVQGTNAAATYDIAFGPWSSSLDSSNWTTQSVTIPAAVDGTFAPGVKRIVVALPAPVANGDDFVVSIRPPDSNVAVINGFNAGGAGCWPTLQFAVDTAISNADIAVDAAWPGGTGNVFFTLATVEFLSLTADPCIQIAHFGDSVGEAEPPVQDVNWFTREGWYIKGNQAEITNGSRFWWSSNANGTYSLSSYLARLTHLITTEWINGVDVVSIQCWTHNQAPVDVAAAITQLAQIEVVADAVRAAGRGVIYTLLAPPSNPHQSADEILAWQYIKTWMASRPHIYLDDLVANGAGTAYASGVSGDGIHVNIAAQETQAAALPARTALALAEIGYAV